MKLEIHADIHIHSHGSEKEITEILHKVNQILKSVGTVGDAQKEINRETSEINSVADGLQNSVKENTPK